ncbi:MAG TPA: hypothetical protein PKC43_08570 [Phycisphaerales bacterium]|nr:hypothetical protein [Phycisphaerales bacterium]HMP37488.1 hypothetical protein [Phycisphaerales bacterium]
MTQLVLVVIFVIAVNAIGAIVRARAQAKERRLRQEEAARLQRSHAAQGRQGGMQPSGAPKRIVIQRPGEPPIVIVSETPSDAPPTGFPSGSGARRSAGAERGGSARTTDERAFGVPRDVAAQSREDARRRAATRRGDADPVTGRLGGALDEERRLASRRAESARRDVARHQADAEAMDRAVRREAAERSERTAAQRAASARAPRDAERPGAGPPPSAPYAIAPTSESRRAAAIPEGWGGERGVVRSSAGGLRDRGAPSIVEALRSPAGLRQAVLLREILGTPPGLR